MDNVSSCETSVEIGPLLDDGAPYSAIGEVELKLMLEENNMQYPEKLNPKPIALDGYTKLPYGSGSHSSKARDIFGSIVLTVLSERKCPVHITHLVLSGSSQWIIGRNVTRMCKIDHLERNALLFYNGNEMDAIKLIDFEFLSYIPLHSFFACDSNNTISCLNANALSQRPWKEIKMIIDKVHKHVCGHATLTDFKLLLERNGLWNASIQDYISSIMRSCRGCKATAPAEPPRKVSISSMSKGLNDVICVDHFCLDDMCFVHIMDFSTRFSMAALTYRTAMSGAVRAFETLWVLNVWYPDTVRGDTAFSTAEFISHLSWLGIKFELVPPGRHYKNAIESKHGIIRSIFILLMEDSSNLSCELKALRAVSISNDLYGNHLVSSFEIAKGYKRPVVGSPVELPDELIDANIKMRQGQSYLLF